MFQRVNYEFMMYEIHLIVKYMGIGLVNCGSSKQLLKSF